jgi:hypothetical protein
VTDDLHPWEEAAEVGGHHPFDRDQPPVPGHGDEVGHRRRYPHAAEELLIVARVPQDDGQVRSQVGYLRERVSLIDGQRGEEGKDSLPKVPVQVRGVRLRQAWDRHDLGAFDLAGGLDSHGSRIVVRNTGSPVA